MPDPLDPVEALRAVAHIAFVEEGRSYKERLDRAGNYAVNAIQALAALPAPVPDKLTDDEQASVDAVRRLRDNGLTYERRLLAIIDRLTAAAPAPEGVPEVVAYLRELTRQPCYCESEHPEKEPSPICLPCAAVRALVASGNHQTNGVR